VLQVVEIITSKTVGHSYCLQDLLSRRGKASTTYWNFLREVLGVYLTLPNFNRVGV